MAIDSPSVVDVVPPELSRRLRRALGDVRQVMQIAGEAAATLVEDDPRLISEVYDLAMRAIGPLPHKVAPGEYAELGARRLEALCRFDPEEARQFHRFLRHYELGLQDGRIYVARASMEARLGNVVKAVIIAEQGLALGASPSEHLATLVETFRSRGSNCVDVSNRATVSLKDRLDNDPLDAREEWLAEVAKPVHSETFRAAWSPEGHVNPAGECFAARDVCGDDLTPRGRPRTLKYDDINEFQDAEFPAVDVEPGAAPGGGDVALPFVPRTVRQDSYASLSPIVEADSLEADRSQTDGTVERNLVAAAAAAAATAASGQRLQQACMQTPPPRRQHSIVDTGVPEVSAAATHGEVKDKVLEGSQAAMASAPAGFPTAASQVQPNVAASAPAADAASSECGASPSGEGTIAGKPIKTLYVNDVPYTRLRVIGRGGSSKVYEVKSLAGELLALKRVATSCVNHFEALANEVTLLQQLAGCPYVVQVIDAEVCPEQGLIHILMERGDTDLSRMLQSESNLGLGDIQALWRQMLEAVHVIHEHRIVHSDLKPANFLLSRCGRLKLIDFGIAKRIANGTTNISREASVGTISYMAPEAVRQGSFKVGRSSDIWSLGIIFYQTVYKRSPFAHLEPMQRILALQDASVDVEFPPGHRLESYSHSTQVELLDVVRRCLNRDPTKRPTIPELLKHPFLQDSIRLNRQTFDHTMQALVTGFFEAAQSALDSEDMLGRGMCLRGDGQGDSGTYEDEMDAASQSSRNAWQELADEMWERLKRHSVCDGRVFNLSPCQEHSLDEADVEVDANQKAPTRDEPNLNGLSTFREWLIRGAKRRRLAALEAANVASGQRAPFPSYPSRIRAPSPALSSPHSLLTPSGYSSAQSGSEIGPRGPANVPLSQPLSSIDASSGAASGIHAELLRKHRDCLKKVVSTSAIGGQQSPRGSTMATHIAPTDSESDRLKWHQDDSAPRGTEGRENPIVRRLRERRALVAEEPTDEMSQVTRWNTPAVGCAVGS
eukprot:TRINITY_DN24945_c0_g1_i1.p1 TRINITY_DN24945_c0_g1~~TRINITY_DN24945_c0_g1_i1.p1  ORF type:complete len:1019 (-),score=137.59 TRINITY_DN24945_c0_g1_i1:550-3573(-)